MLKFVCAIKHKIQGVWLVNYVVFHSFVTSLAVLVTDLLYSQTASVDVVDYL